MSEPTAMDDRPASSIGDIHWDVFTDPDRGPYLTKMRLESISPGGRKARWRAMYVLGQPVHTFDTKSPPSGTRVEAIRQYQRDQMRFFPFVSDVDLDERIRLILQAELMKDRAAARDAVDATTTPNGGARP